MLEVQNLSRRYGSFTAVDNVGFTIDKGEIVGLLGHNGAGKTTIMKMLSGYLEPHDGSVLIDGVDLAAEPKAVQRGLGYLPENLPVYPEMSVADFLDYAANLKGLQSQSSSLDKEAEIKRVVGATEIGEKLLAPIATLSRGYKQRVGVAQAILGRPKLLILDEPTNGLDPTQTEHMRQLIRDIAREATVILSTHIMQEVDAVCDRVLILNDGRLAVDAKLNELRQSNSLLLNTSMEQDEVSDILSRIDGVDSEGPQHIDISESETQSSAKRYRIPLRSGADVEPVCAAVAKAVIDSGAQLYQLQREQRDLETLFREVSNAPTARREEGLSDAA